MDPEMKKMVGLEDGCSEILKGQPDQDIVEGVRKKDPVELLN